MDATMLGKKCSWRSTTTGALLHGFVVAMRLDEKLQVYPDRFNVPWDELPWRPRSLVEVESEAAVDTSRASGQHSGKRGAPCTDLVPCAGMIIVYVKNVRKGTEPEVLKEDFQADDIRMQTASTAALIYKDQTAADAALAWSGTMYKGLWIKVCPHKERLLAIKDDLQRQ